MPKPVFKEPCVLFRGIQRLGNKQLVSAIAKFIDKESHENKNNLIKTLETILHDRQSSLFIATSTTFEVGYKFSQQGSYGTRILFKYHIPSFYPFLVLNGFFQSKFVAEYELLLPPDHRWKIDNVQMLSSGITQEHVLLVDLKLDLEEDNTSKKDQIQSNNRLYKIENTKTEEYERKNKENKEYERKNKENKEYERKNKENKGYERKNTENKEDDLNMKDEKFIDLWPSYFPESKLNQQKAYHELNILLHDWIFETLKTKQTDPSVISVIEQRNFSSYKFFGLFQKFIAQSLTLSTPVTVSRFQKYIETQVDLKNVQDIDFLFYVLYQRKGAMTASQKWFLQQQQINEFKDHPDILNCLKYIPTKTFISSHIHSDEWKDIDQVPCYTALMDKTVLNTQFSFAHLLKKRVLYFDSQAEVEQFCQQIEEMSSSIFLNDRTSWKTIVKNTTNHITWTLYFCWYWEIEAFIWKQNSNLYASKIIYTNVSPPEPTNNSMNQTW